jgi:hypothetical protein
LPSASNVKGGLQFTRFGFVGFVAAGGAVLVAGEEALVAVDVVGNSSTDNS